MSFAVEKGQASRAAASPGEPPASATVLDFICLFTHDLKRKQKRWQDGKLKYHTFNKRVMVYDDRGSFIGDAHWQADYDIEEGEELRLDRGSAIVQVSECTGSREQDLTEIIDKRAKEVEQRRANAMARTPVSTARPSTTPRPDSSRPQFPLHHRPLSTIVPSPGAIGRANIPGHSPYEARRAVLGADQFAPVERPPPARKRRRSVSPPSKSGHARSLFGATLTLTASPMPLSMARAAALREKTNVQPATRPSSTAKIPESPESQPVDADADVIMLDGPPSSVEVTSAPTAAEETRDIISLRGNPVPTPAPVPVAKTKKVRLAKEPPSKEASSKGLGEEITDKGGKRDKRIPVQHTDPKPSKSLTGAHASHASHASKSSRPETIQLSHVPVHGPLDPETSHPAKHKSPHDTPLPSEAASSEMTIHKSGPDIDSSTASTESGQRATLRIRSRQKRGLLMVSEKRQRAETTTSERSATISESCRGSKKSHDLQNTTGKRPSEVSQTADPAISIESLSSTSDSEGEKPRTMSTRKKQSEATAKYADSVYNKRGRFLETSPVPIRDESAAPVEHLDKSELASPLLETHPERRKDVPSHASTRQAERETASHAPRIARMARKSIRSREIIGFVAPHGDAIIPALTPKPAAAPISPMHGNVPQMDDSNADSTIRGNQTDECRNSEQVTNTVVEKQKELQGISETTEQTHQGIGSRPKIANPATRGKKAAKKEDAAGKTPQSLVLPEPVVTAGVGIAAARRETTKDVLPGFLTANGGAWSKHALDLLGMARPTGGDALLS